MTGSYFYNKIILIVAFVAFLVGGFFPVGSVEAAREVSEVGQSASEGVKETFGEGSSSKNEEIYCIKWNLSFSFSGCVAMGAYAILGVASWVLWLSAILFNSTINYTLNMAGFIKDIPIVALGWTTFRDVTNLMFVFIILYIAINTIVGNEGYGIKKLLGKVIITAMLINFSLFFTQAMIDASNIFALQFYHKIIQDSADRSEGINDLDAGISAAFVNGLGLQEVWGIGKKTAATPGAQVVDINNNKELGLNAENLIIVGLGGTVLVLITAFIFFAATIMFLLRAITLIFLMILSPLAFMGGILPSLGKHTGEWWSKLMNNLLFAPVYMALLYLIIHMITKGGFTGVAGGGSFYQLFNGNKNMIGAAMTFFVLNAMMVGCLIIASKFGASGSGWAMKTGKSWGSGLGMSLSGANLAIGAGRNLAGRVGDGVSKSTFLANMSTRPGFGRLAAYTMQRGDKLKDAKIGGKSFNEQVKDTQKDYTKRGNLIESALLEEIGPEPAANAPQAEKDAYKLRKDQITKAAAKKEGDYLAGKRFSYASNSAMKKAAKSAKGTNNKEALDSLLKGKFSQEEHEKAKAALDGPLKDEIASTRNIIKTSTNRNEISNASAKLAVLMGEKKEMQDIVDGHLRTVEKLANIDSK